MVCVGQQLAKEDSTSMFYGSMVGRLLSLENLSRISQQMVAPNSLTLGDDFMGWVQA